MKTRNGFTLIELLVSVTIIGIMASIAVAQVSSYRRRAYDSIAINISRDALAAGAAAQSDGLAGSMRKLAGGSSVLAPTADDLTWTNRIRTILTDKPFDDIYLSFTSEFISPSGGGTAQGIHCRGTRAATEDSDRRRVFYSATGAAMYSEIVTLDSMLEGDCPDS